jgi:predicted oxidoreductase
MATDRIDLLLIHRPDPLMDHQETGRALDALVASGKVRAVGVSNFRPWDWSLLQSAMETPLVTNQIELSAMHLAPSPTAISRSTRSAGTRSWRGRRSAVVRLFTEEGAAVREVLTRIGHEQGVDPARWRWRSCLRHPARILPVMGARSVLSASPPTASRASRSTRRS